MEGRLGRLPPGRTQRGKAKAPVLARLGVQRQSLTSVSGRSFPFASSSCHWPERSSYSMAAPSPGARCSSAASAAGVGLTAGREGLRKHIADFVRPSAVVLDDGVGDRVRLLKNLPHIAIANDARAPSGGSVAFFQWPRR